jgi:hypothetical protein
VRASFAISSAGCRIDIGALGHDFVKLTGFDELDAEIAGRRACRLRKSGQCMDARGWRSEITSPAAVLTPVVTLKRRTNIKPTLWEAWQASVANGVAPVTGLS